MFVTNLIFFVFLIKIQLAQSLEESFEKFIEKESNKNGGYLIGHLSPNEENLLLKPTMNEISKIKTEMLFSKSELDPSTSINGAVASH